MATEILRPQAVVFPRRKSCNYDNSYSNPKATTNPIPNPRSSRRQHQQAVRSEKQDQRKRFVQPEPSIPKSSSSDVIRAVKTGHVMEKVTILRRGESLESKIKSGPAPIKKGVDMVAKSQLHEVEFRSPLTLERHMYAGSAFATSPEPSSLPLPSFSKKKQMSFDDAATKDLMRLLRLD